MNFQKLLLDTEKALRRDEMQSLAFLCTDILRQNLSSVEFASDLFTRLVDQDHLSAENPQLLADLLLTIHRPRLVRELGLTDQLSITQSRISSYRKLLYNLSEDITAEDLRRMKFLLDRSLPRKKLEENVTTLEVFLALEHKDLLSDTNLTLLECLFEDICPILNEKIKEFKESQVCNTGHIAQETGQLKSASYPLLPHQEAPSFCSAIPAAACQTSGVELSESFASSPVPCESATPLPESSSMSSSDTSVDYYRVSYKTDETLSHDLKRLSTGSSNCEYLKGSYQSVAFETTQSAENHTSPPGQIHATNLNNEGLGTYLMTSATRGVCLIINNYDFSNSIQSQKNREGTMVDEKSLKTVFQWLGFEMEIKNDCTREQILLTLDQLRSRNHSGVDCLVCCVLSHGAEGSVYGVDGQTVELKELTRPFDGMQCPSLIEKPKLFFIQACQGTKVQKPVCIQEDGPAAEPICIEADALKDTIPSDADFLMGIATVPYCVSYRETSKGTWFIQSLCKNLVQMVPKGIDLVSILTKVNADVSQRSSPMGTKKQMPQPAFSLRKRVVFPVPKDPPPTC